MIWGLGQLAASRRESRGSADQAVRRGNGPGLGRSGGSIVAGNRLSETIKRAGLPRLTREARAALTGNSTVGTSLASATTSTHPTQRFWVIHAGQTLGLVAAATGLSVAAIEQLNPYADPGELIPGQRIWLRAATPKPLHRP